MTFIGIDPGHGGGIVALSDDGTVLVAKRMPQNEEDVLEALRLCNPRGARAYIERAWSSPQMGVVSAFTFGRGFGGLLMALTAWGVHYNIVLPRQWQQAMGCLTGGDKNISKARAQALFPAIKVTHATADALLIAEHCRRVHHALFSRPPAKRRKAKTHGTKGHAQVQGEDDREGATSA